MPSLFSRAFLPFHFLPTPAASAVLGRNRHNVAVLALQAVLLHRRGIEVAHQQIRYRGQDFAFSSRINSRGELVIDLDIGDPALKDRLILEEDLRRAIRAIPKVKGVNP